MAKYYWIISFLVFSSLYREYEASVGDSDPSYRSCLDQFENTGCIGERCFSHCKLSSDGSSLEGPWYQKESLSLRWNQWSCQSDCRYYCMFDREKQRAELGQEPVKYHGKWLFRRVYGLQEPVSVAFSALNLAMNFHGWLSFLNHIHHKLPLKLNKRTFYDYTGLWNIYGLVSINSWFWGVVFHIRDVPLTETIYCSSAVFLIGYSLILAIIRSFSLTDEASRVMVTAPLISFTITHIFYLNIYKLDYEWNLKVCGLMATAQILTWSIWAGVIRHPSRWKLWIVVVGGGLAKLVEIYYDFPPYQGLVDAHALWQASIIPLTCLWWSFIKDDSSYRTSSLLKKAK